MTEKKEIAEVSQTTKQPNVFMQNFSVLGTPEGFQKYILGSKKNGTPRAVYDVIKDCTQDKKKKKKKDKNVSAYDLYLGTKKKKKKKKKNKKNKYWHIDMF